MHLEDPTPIRPTTAADAAALRGLRLEALRTEPLAFTADLAETAARPDEWWRELAAHGRTGVGGGGGGGGIAAPAVVMVIDAGSGQLGGMAGVIAAPQPKLAHAGTVWGVYVRPPLRGRGLAAALVRACAAWAADRSLVTVRLSVAAGNDAARRCYERCGFAVYGVEPLAIQWEGRYYDEALMALRLADPPPAGGAPGGLGQARV